MARWRAAGFTLDPARERQLRLALHREGNRFVGRLEELHFLLSPHVASNAKEQAEFYRLWQDFVAEYQAEYDQLEEADVSVLTEEQPPKPKPWWPWLLLLPMIAALAYFYFDGAGWQKEDPVTISFTSPAEYLLQEGDTVRFKNTTSTGPLDSAGFNWQVMDLATDSVLTTSDSFDLDWIVPYGSCRRIRVDLKGEHLFTGENPVEKQSHTVITCGSPPTLRALNFPESPLQRNDRFDFSVQAEAEVIYRWRFGSGEPYRYGPRQNFTFTEEGSYDVELKAMRLVDSVCCYKTYFRSVQVGTNLPLLTSLPLVEDQPRQFLRVAKWGWWFLYLLLFIVISAWLSLYRNLHSRREVEIPDETHLQAEYPIHDAGPYDIPYRDQSAAISVPADFYRIADQLRIREAGLRKRFDGRATVEATVRNGGFPRWRERAVKRPAEYLLLVPHANERQQQHRLLTRLGQFLLEQEAAVKVYFHSGRFDRFWNDDQPDGIAPEQLVGRYPDFRLVILGDGHGLLDPYESRGPRLLPRWQEVFSRWRRRLILTTEPVTDWSFQEKLLHRYFLLYPVDSRGIRLGVEALNAVEDYDAANFNRWEAELLPRHQEPSHRYRHWNTVEEHREYLADDPDLFRWLGGLCVVSQPDWNLTIAIGRALGIEVTHDRLLRLSRIPWLADNAPDHSLRLELISTLSAADETLARQAALGELEAIKTEVAGSFAQTDWTSNRAVQQFALDPASPANKQSIRELRSIGWLTNDQLDELDRKIEKGNTTNGRAETRNAHLDEWLNRPEDKTWLNRRFYVTVLMSLLILVLTFFAWNFDQSGKLLEEGRPLKFWQSSENVDDLALELNNEAVATMRRLDTISNLADFKVAVPEWKSALALLDSAKKIRAPEPYAIADSNRLVGTFNLLRKGYNLSAIATGSHYLGMDSLEAILALEDDYDYERLFTDTTRTAQLILHGTGVIFMSSWMSEYDGLFAHPEKVKGSGFLHGLEYDLTLETFWRLDSVNGGNFFSSIANEMPVNLKTMLRRYGRDTLDGEIDEPVTVETDRERTAEQTTSEQEQIEFTNNPDSTGFYIITGQLVDELGQPLIGYNLFLYSEEGYSTETGPIITRVKTSGPNGRFFITIQTEEDEFLIGEMRPDYQEGEEQIFKKVLARATREQPDVGRIVLRSEQDPFQQLIEDFQTKRFVTAILNSGDQLAFSRYLNSVLLNAAENTITDLSDLPQQMDRDLNVELESPGVTESAGVFLLFGKDFETSGIDLTNTQNRALVVEVNDYQNVSNLDGPEESRQIAATLDRLGFSVKFLENPSQETFSFHLNSEVEAFKQNTDNTGQFLLYFKGYGGEIDKGKGRTGTGLFMSDYDPANSANGSFDFDNFLKSDKNFIVEADHLMVLLNAAPAPTLYVPPAEKVILTEKEIQSLGFYPQDSPRLSGTYLELALDDPIDQKLISQLKTQLKSNRLNAFLVEKIVDEKLTQKILIGEFANFEAAEQGDFKLYYMGPGKLEYVYAEDFEAVRVFRLQ